MNLDLLSFRWAQAQDILPIVSLVNSAYRGESGKQGWTTEADLLDGQRTDTEEVMRLIDTAGSLILLGQIGKELVASVHVEQHEEGAFLGMLAVSPAWQSRGIGRAMMTQAERMAVLDFGAQKMLMTVITLRQELIGFYARCGYVRTGRVRPFPVSEKFGIQKVPGLLLEYLEKPLTTC